MTDGRGPDQGWKREDLHFVLDSEPQRYLEHVDGPVQFVTVAAAGDTLGYLWFDDAGDAANFVFSADSGNRARNARGAWIRELLSAKSRGLTPSQAVAELAAEAGNARIGWIGTDSLAEAESVFAMEALAGTSQARPAELHGGGTGRIAMSIRDESTFDPVLADAIVAYVGKGRLKIPTADAQAVRALERSDSEDLLRRVREAIADRSSNQRPSGFGVHHQPLLAADRTLLMEAMQFHSLVKGFWGAKASTVSFSPSTTVFTCVLYEAFEFVCGLDGEHGTFTGGIQIAPGRFITHFVGGRLSRNTDEASILANLQLVDEYCRLRLPDKYLDAFDSRHGAGR